MLMLGLKGLIVLESVWVSDLITEDVFFIACFGRRKDISEQIGKKEGVKA